MITDTLAQSHRYTALSPRFAKAFEFLRQLRADHPLGRVDLEGDDCFALVQTYTTKPHAEAKFEAHRKYTDIQFIQSGRETLFWSPLTELKQVTELHDDTRDIAFFATPSRVTAINLHAGEFAIFFPEDGHAPMLEFQGATGVRKVVIKICV
jgi:YhcH/YjgK/YiaL family protein